MSAVARLGAFVAALALVFAMAFAAGGAVDPIGQDPAPDRSEDPVETTTVPAHDQDHDSGGHP